jgi:hypothetical protein
MVNGLKSIKTYSKIYQAIEFRLQKETQRIEFGLVRMTEQQ